MDGIELASKFSKSRLDCSTFTEDQKIAYANLIEFINEPFNERDFKRGLVGPGGTGKTYLIKTIISNCKFSNSVIGLAAPTHKAATVLETSIRGVSSNVNTLQSDLGLQLNFEIENFDINNPPFDPKGTVKISNYKLYIVDEASMINRDLVTFLEKICKENNTKLIYVGDDSQLAPVGEKYSPAFKGLTAFALTENVRQGEDNPISELLEILRDDILHNTYNFISYVRKFRLAYNKDMTKGYETCDESRFLEVVNTNFSDNQITKNVDFVKVVAYTNNKVSVWNKHIRNTIIKDSDKSIITKNDLLLSYRTIVDQFNQPIIRNSEEYIVNDIVNYVNPEYNIKGFLVRFQAVHGGDISKPLFIVDHTDKSSITIYYNIINVLLKEAMNAKKFDRSSKWRKFYKFTESCLLLTNIRHANGNKCHDRDIDYGFALTSHKSQGSTFDTVCVDMVDMIYDTNGNQYPGLADLNRRLYVACSRCRNKLYLRF